MPCPGCAQPGSPDASAGTVPTPSGTHGQPSDAEPTPTDNEPGSSDTQPGTSTAEPTPPSEPTGSAPPEEPSASTTQGGGADPPPPRPAKKLAVKAGSPVIPGGGAAGPPAVFEYSNDSRYPETVEIHFDEPGWAAVDSTCENLAPRRDCEFTVVYRRKSLSAVEIFADVESVCTNKRSYPCSLLPATAKPTSRSPVIATWRDWIGRLDSHPVGDDDRSAPPSAESEETSPTPSDPPTPEAEESKVQQPPLSSPDGLEDPSSDGGDSRDRSSSNSANLEAQRVVS